MPVQERRGLMLSDKSNAPIVLEVACVQVVRIEPTGSRNESRDPLSEYQSCQPGRTSNQSKSSRSP
jgi:hypothetical protein